MPVSAQDDWYFKLGYPNYAPSGMPDFNQTQDKWQRINCGPDGILNSANASDDLIVGPPEPYKQLIVPGPNCTLDSTLNTSSDDFVQWCFSGPVAVANCLWWFDSKYANHSGTPGDGEDECLLVEDYGAGDDHSSDTVPRLIERLAGNMPTSINGTTNISNAVVAIDDWLNETGLNDTLYVHIIPAPNFTQIEEEIERSQDVILWLGFWQNRTQPPTGNGVSGTGIRIGYWRLGWHYVTCAGVNSNESMIALSDPFFDNNASGNGPGRMVPDLHPDGYTSTFHNDAQNVSHDYYNVTEIPDVNPFFNWSLSDYPISLNPELVENFLEGERDTELPIHTLIELAVVISPKGPTGEATDAIGGTKDLYYTYETVYATGSGFVPGSLVNIYITEDKHWEDGMPINSTVYARKDNVTVDPGGNIVGEEIWPNPIPGEYDMIFDQDQDGFYNVGRDAVDNPNDPGFTVVAQAPALTPLGLIALVGLLTIIATSTIVRKRKKR